MSNFKPNKIVNINSVKTKNGNINLKADDGYYDISYYKTQTDFYDPKAYIAFIKAVEKLVRSSDEYKTYINYLKTEIGLDYCSIFGKITDDKVAIEMHHGPIFTLFDIVSIVLEHCLLHNEKITTYSIAKIVLQEHFDNNIQVVMLCKTAHESVHAGKIYISPRQAWGDINKFIERYGDGLSNDQIETYNQILDIEEKNGRTTDNGLFKISSIKSWKNNVPDLTDNDLDEENEIETEEWLELEEEE